MALTTSASGTKTGGALDTIYDLANDTVAGVYVAMWNLELNVKSDITRLYVKTKVLTGDTLATVFEGVYANDYLTNCIIVSPPIVSMFSITMSMEQTDGTWRDVPWSLIRIAT